MLKKLILLSIAAVSFFSAAAFAAEKESIVARPWNGERELKGAGLKKFSSTWSSALPLESGKTYRFKCNVTKNPPLSKTKHNHQMVLYGMKNQKRSKIFSFGAEVPADDDVHEVNKVFTIPADFKAPFSLALYNAYGSGTVIVEDFVITEIKKH